MIRTLPQKLLHYKFNAWDLIFVFARYTITSDKCRPKA